MYVPLAGLGNLTSSLTKASKNILESFAVPSNHELHQLLQRISIKHSTNSKIIKNFKQN